MKKSNAIENVVSTLSNPKKPSKAIVMLSGEDTLKAVSGYAQGFMQGEKAIEVMNTAIKPFHDAGVKLCKASEKSSPLFDYSNEVRTMFIDVFTKQGKKKLYIEKQLYPAFLRAVNSGKALTAINLAQEKNKAKGKGEKKEPAIDTMIAKLISHTDFSKLPEILQDEIKDYLESEGYEITE